MTDDDSRQLVEVLGRQFTAIDRPFDPMDQRFARAGEAFREILGHPEGIYGLLERLEQEYYSIVEGLRRIEMILADERGQRELLERGLAEMKERVALLQARIDELERRLRT